MSDNPNLEKYKSAIHATAKAIARNNISEKREKFDKISKNNASRILFYHPCLL